MIHIEGESTENCLSLHSEKATSKLIKQFAWLLSLSAIASITPQVHKQKVTLGHTCNNAQWHCYDNAQGRRLEHVRHGKNSSSHTRNKKRLHVWPVKGLQCEMNTERIKSNMIWQYPHWFLNISSMSLSHFGKGRTTLATQKATLGNTVP